MSRGGRGGGGGGQGIYDYDTALDDYVNARSREIEGDDDWLQAMYPDVKLHAPPAPTAQERRLVSRWREHRTAMRNGPFYIDTPQTSKRDASEFNAFEDANTYSNTKRPKFNGGLPNLKKVPIVKDLLPAELRDLVGDGEEDEDHERTNTTKNLQFLKKTRIDRLARFDEGADLEANADKDDDDELNENDKDDEDGVEELQDDDFSEDDDDLGNDYNAEKYFDDGDGADDEGDGGDHEEAW